MQLDYNTDTTKSQEGAPQVLHDVSPSGRERPWHIHKLTNQYISATYDEVNPRKAARLAQCAQALIFTRRQSGGLKLKHADFCRVRLCPICAWRRSLKTAAHVNKIITAAESEHLDYIMVTLTLHNCSGDKLSTQLDKIIGGYKKLVKRKRYLQAWVGWYRGVEVTHNTRDDTYHPHIHALVGVKPSYFKGRKYIKQSDLAQDWREVCGVDYTPIVDIRRVKRYNGAGATSRLDIIKAVNEVAKYTTKAGDIINFDDWDMTIATVALLDKAFDKRRFIAFGGLFKQLHAQLNLTDEEDGDLLHIEEDGGDAAANADDDLLFWWHTGYGRYVL